MPTHRRVVTGAAATLAVAALLYTLAADARVGYDSAYQLVWGCDLGDGRLPHYDLRLAPTPHPLQVLVSVPLSALGQGADEAMRALSLLGPTIRPIPYLALWTGADPSQFTEPGPVPPMTGALVIPTEASASWIGGNGHPPPQLPVPADYAEAAENAGWRVLATC